MHPVHRPGLRFEGRTRNRLKHGPVGAIMRPLLFALLLLCAGCLQAQPEGNGGSPPTAAAPDVERVGIDLGEGDAFEPMAVVDPRDPEHIVVVASEHRPDASGRTHRWNIAYASFDGGRSWTRSEIPGGPSAGLDHPLVAATDMGDAVAAFLPDGTVLYAGLALNFFEDTVLRGYDLYVARSTDGGRTFPEVTVVASGRGLAVIGPLEAPVAWFANDKEWLSTGEDGTALLGWTEIEFPPLDDPASGEVGQNDAVFSVSRDGGRTWSAPALVATTGYSGSYPLLEPDGTWHIALYNYNIGSLHMATSFDEGATWGLQTLAGSTPSVAWPVLFLHEGAIHYGHTADGEGDRPAARVLTSADHGATWQPSLKFVNSGEVSWAQHTFAADGAGRLHVLGYDGGEDGLDMTLWTQADGELSHRILDAGLAGSSGPRSHYLGLVGLPTGAFAVWVTGDPGAFDLVGARVTWA